MRESMEIAACRDGKGSEDKRGAGIDRIVLEALEMTHDTQGIR